MSNVQCPTSKVQCPQAKPDRQGELESTSKSTSNVQSPDDRIAPTMHGLSRSPKLASKHWDRGRPRPQAARRRERLRTPVLRPNPAHCSLIAILPLLKQSRRIALVFIFSAALIATAALILTHHCPASGIAFSTERRELHRLKNRTAIPQPADFDTAVTLAKMLQPGDDRERWSQTRAARVEGYVVSIANGPSS